MTVPVAPTKKPPGKAGRNLPVAIGVGVGIGFVLACVLRPVLMNGIVSLSEFRQHRHDAIQQSFAGRVLLRRKCPANLQNVLNRSAL